MWRTILIASLIILAINLIEPLNVTTFQVWDRAISQVQSQATYDSNGLFSWGTVKQKARELEVAFGEFTRSFKQENSGHHELPIDKIWSATSSTLQDAIEAIRASFDEIKAAFKTLNAQCKELAETLAGAQ